jgi:DNA replication and repair protein RecF
MIVDGLWVQDFRSFSDEQWKFRAGLNVVQAQNGSGKSNLIEALSLLSTGTSWRARTTDEFIRWEAEYARLQAKVILRDREEVKLEQMLTHGTLQGKKTLKRLYKVNGVGRRAQEATGQFLTVLFAPEDMVVFQNGPSERRRLLDGLLSQVSREYRYALHQYEQALRRRNKLIGQLREGKVSRYDFFYWDQLLIEHGEIIFTERQNFLMWLSEREGIKETYKVVYEHSIVSEERIRQYAEAEVGAGHTLIGPHKDDVAVQVYRGGEWRPIGTYGSRGEQRLSLVWWKLHELEYIEEKRQETPVLLLDDVFSELDQGNQYLLLEKAGRAQTILTTIDVLPELTAYQLLLYSNGDSSLS